MAWEMCDRASKTKIKQQSRTSSLELNGPYFSHQPTLTTQSSDSLSCIVSVREKTAARALIQTSHIDADIHLQDSHRLPTEG